MLTFVIPTYNRPEQLAIAVRSIADQITLGRYVGIDIVIVDDSHGLFEIHPVIDKLANEYPFIKVQETPQHGDYSDAFKIMFQQGFGREVEWIWTFGDDDRLIPGALDFIVPKLLESEDAFIHIAEASRVARSDNPRAYRGTLLDLSNEFGWIEMTGFITGNICRGSLLAQAANLPNWKLYAKSSFVQSCALLEVLKDKPCTFMDIPLIGNQTAQQTEHAIALWNEQNIAGRYLYLAEAVEAMFEQGILTTLVNPKFFRYIEYHLWDRFLSMFASDYIERRILWADDIWHNVVKFPRFINDPTVAKQIMQDVDLIKGLSTLHSYMSRNLSEIEKELIVVRDRHTERVYPWNYSE